MPVAARRQRGKLPSFREKENDLTFSQAFAIIRSEGGRIWQQGWGQKSADVAERTFRRNPSQRTNPGKTAFRAGADGARAFAAKKFLAYAIVRDKEHADGGT